MKKALLTYLRQRPQRTVVLIILIILISFVIYRANADIQSLLRVERDIIAARNLEKIHAAQEQFNSLNGKYGTLEELAEAGLLEPYLAGDRKALKFSYRLSDLSPTTFCAHADRKSRSAGDRDFNMSEDGVLHFKESKTIGSIPRGQGETTRD